MQNHAVQAPEAMGRRFGRALRGRGGPWRSGAGGFTSARRPGDAGRLHVVNLELFYGLDPVHEFTASYLRSVGAAETLLRITPAGDVDVELARSFELVDPFTWRVGLRPEATFWSGKPVTARAVAESLERSRALAPVAATLLRGVRIEPVDEWTVLFQSDNPIPGLPLNLQDSWLAIHNAESYGPQDNSFDIAAADLTGFYRIATFEPRVRSVLVRQEAYWGPRARMPRLRFDEVGENDARSLVALSGEAHIVRSITTTAATQIERSRTMRLVSVPATGVTNAYLNVQKAPFDDVRVRQALSWALDREEQVALAFDGRGSPASSWLAPNPFYGEARRVGYTRQDLQKAAQLLDEAGWRLAPGRRVRARDGVPLRFRLYWWGPHRPIVEVLQSQWERVGAEVLVDGSSDYGFLQQKRAQNDWDVFIEGWGTFGEPSAVLSRHVAPEGDLNYMRFRDPVIEELLAGFDALHDLEERRQQALRINERHAEVVPFISLYSRHGLTAVSRDLRSYVPPFPGGGYEVTPDTWVAA